MKWTIVQSVSVNISVFVKYTSEMNEVMNAKLTTRTRSVWAFIFTSKPCLPRNLCSTRSSSHVRTASDEFPPVKHLVSSRGLSVRKGFLGDVIGVCLLAELCEASKQRSGCNWYGL